MSEVKPRGELLDYPEGTAAIAVDYGKEPITVRYWSAEGQFLGDQVIFDESWIEKSEPVGEWSPEPMPGNPPTMEQAMNLIDEEELKPQFEVHKAREESEDPPWGPPD
jgi:hypothetical protein